MDLRDAHLGLQVAALNQACTLLHQLLVTGRSDGETAAFERGAPHQDEENQ